MIIIYYLALSLLIFFIFNYFFNNKYKIFLGDAGSMFLGFMIAWICIFISQRNTSIPVALIPWILSYPVFDLISTVLIRISKRKSPFNPDHNHLHFILMKKLNLNKLNINLVILLITFVLNLIGFLLYVSITEEYIYLIYVFLFFLFHFYKLKYVN